MAKAKKEKAVQESSSSETHESPKKFADAWQKFKTAVQKIGAVFSKENLQAAAHQTLKVLKKGLFYLAGILAVTAILIVVDLHSSQRIYPRVSVGPVHLGYNFKKEAQDKLQLEVNSFLKKPLAFRMDGKETTISPSEMGITFSAEQALKKIPTLDFTRTNFFFLVTALAKEQKYDLPFNANNDKIITLLEKKLDFDKLKSKNARFTLDNKKKLQIEAEQQGKAIDRTKFVADLQNNLQNLTDNPVVIELKPEKPSVTTAQLANYQQHFEKVLGQPLTLMYENRKWKFNPLEHVDAIAFDSKVTAEVKEAGWILPVSLDKEIDSDAHLQITSVPSISLNEEKLQEYLEKEIISKIQKPTSDVKISKDKEEKIVIEGKGENGLEVSQERFIAHLNFALNNSVKTVQIPVKENKAQVEISPDLNDLGIKTLLATGHSSYYGSPANRVHNIGLGIKKYNGFLVKPGETFSFNQILGEVDGKHGFLPEKVIKQNKIEYEYGGGICQVSTTLYRGALLAGLPIVERSPHSWKVSYYGQVLGHGLDATIYPGVADLKFLNDTKGYILIQSYAEDGNAYFKLYGTDDGRKATLEGPFGGGLSYQWFRHLSKNGQTTKETIISKYRPIPPPEPKPAPPPPKGPATPPTA
jgi:vancomycin resistance protein YoaR